MLRERETPYEMKVVAVALSPIARFVDQGAHNRDAEAADRALLWRSIQVGGGVGKRIERRPVIDKIDCQPAVLPTERDGDTPRRKLHPLVSVFNDVGEQLFEDDKEPRPFVIGKGTIACKRFGKGFEPDELCGFAAQGDRSPHRDLTV